MSTVKGGGSNRRPAADRWALRGPVAAGDPPHGARVGSTPPPSRCGHARLAPRHQTVSRQLGPPKGHERPLFHGANVPTAAPTRGTRESERRGRQTWNPHCHTAPLFSPRPPTAPQHRGSPSCRLTPKRRVPPWLRAALRDARGNDCGLVPRTHVRGPSVPAKGKRVLVRGAVLAAMSGPICWEVACFAYLVLYVHVRKH